MSKTTNKFSPEVRDRAVRMVFSHEGEDPSRWAAIVSISSKIGCVPQTLNEWVKKAEVDSGQRAGMPSLRRTFWSTVSTKYGVNSTVKAFMWPAAQSSA